MKIILAYTIWNKVDMLAYLMQGIVENFSPTSTKIIFHFDGCTDGGPDAFDALIPYWFEKRGGFPASSITTLVSNPEIREVGAHNLILKKFMADMEYDFCVICQDDQRRHKPVAAGLERLQTFYGPRLGMVGGRDGFRWGFKDLTASLWSDSDLTDKARRIKPDEFVEVPYINSGPVIYSRSVVQKVGLLDDDFVAYNVWVDYGIRARQAGLVNGVLGTDMTHARFGRTKETTWCSKGIDDEARLKSKYTTAQLQQF